MVQPVGGVRRVIVWGEGLCVEVLGDGVMVRGVGSAATR